MKLLKKIIAAVCAASLLFSQISLVSVVAADKTAPKITLATPKNNQTGISVKQTLSMKFSESIYKGTYYSKIKLTKSNVKVSVKMAISGNYLKISHSSALKYNTYYVLTIPAKAIKDKAGNQLAKSFTVRFKTKAEPELSIAEIAKKSKGVVFIELFNKDGEEYGTASGVIVNDKIITNCHVIARAYSAIVSLENGDTYDVLGVYSYNAYSDIAILRINADALPTMELGDSSKLYVGQQVVAIGNPLGYQNTVSTGIISGLRYQDIQISVPISFGSSGGALFDMYGKVVGITSSGYNTIGEINFAVPINTVKPMLESTTIKSLEQVRNELYPYVLEETEPNGTALTANILPSSKLAVGILSEKTDKDYYKFLVTSPDDYYLYSSIGDDGWYCDNYKVTLKDSNLTDVKQATVYLDKDSGCYYNEIRKVHLEPGTYYILVEANEDDYYYSTSVLEYSLYWGIHEDFDDWYYDS